MWRLEHSLPCLLIKNSKVPILGLTGGIATGKTTFAPLLMNQLPEAKHFDSDRCVHELLAEDKLVGAQILEAFGNKVFGEDGRPSRRKLRETVFDDSGSRKKLESIIHPIVRHRWATEVMEARRSNAWLLVDIPLLYETGAQSEFDRVIVVACPKETQINRLNCQRGLALELAVTIIATQLDIDAKTQLADHVIWNDSTVSNLNGQSELLAAWLKRHLG